MASVQRITVRLDAAQLAKIKSLCGQGGCDVSQVVRQALDHFFALTLAQNSAAPTEVAETPAISAAQSEPGCYTFPAQLEDLLSRFRHCGMQICDERRRLFRNLVAAAEVAREYSENSRDAEVCSELLRVGHSYGLI